jgi:hypothetical protein
LNTDRAKTELVTERRSHLAQNLLCTSGEFYITTAVLLVGLVGNVFIKFSSNFVLKYKPNYKCILSKYGSGDLAHLVIINFLMLYKAFSVILMGSRADPRIYTIVTFVLYGIDFIIHLKMAPFYSSFMNKLRAAEILTGFFISFYSIFKDDDRVNRRTSVGISLTLIGFSFLMKVASERFTYPKIELLNVKRGKSVPLQLISRAAWQIFKNTEEILVKTDESWKDALRYNIFLKSGIEWIDTKDLRPIASIKEKQDPKVSDKEKDKKTRRPARTIMEPSTTKTELAGELKVPKTRSIRANPKNLKGFN